MSADNVEIVRRLYERWERVELFETADAFDPQVNFARVAGETDMTAVAGEWGGFDDLWSAVVEWIGEWTAFRVEAERFVEVGARVLVLTTQEGVGRRSGVRLDRLRGDVFSLRDLHVVRWESSLGPRRGETRGRARGVAVSANLDLVRSIFAEKERAAAERLAHGWG